MRCLLLAAVLLGPVVFAGESASPNASTYVKQFIEADAGGRDSAEREIRKLGMTAVAALREAKPEGETVLERLRNLLTDIVLENAQVDVADAAQMHEIAREEGRGKRYSNAERLYRRAEQLYDKLKDEAGKRKDRSREKEYEEQRDICDRMKDKAGHKLKGKSHTGVDLGFVRIGKEHDMSDDWE